MDEESKETEKVDDTTERKYGNGRGGWRSGRGYTNQYKYRRGGRNMFKRDNYPTVELPNVDVKLSYENMLLMNRRISQWRKQNKDMKGSLL